MPWWFFKRFKTPKATISLIGLDGAGKTTILNFLQYGKLVKTQPTLGVDVEELNLYGLKLKVWDLGGQKEFRKLWGEYVEKSDALVYVLDGSNKQRLDEAANEFKKAVRYLRQGAPIAVFINKIDLEDVVSVDEVIKKFELTKLSNHPWQVFKTSGKYGFGLVYAFSWIYKKITGKEISFKIDLDDIIIIDEGGNPVVNLGSESGIPVEQVSLVSEALKQFTSRVFKAPITSIYMRGRKVIMHEGKRLSALAIVSDQEDDQLVGDFLSKLLEKLESNYNDMGYIDREYFRKLVEEALTV